MKNVFKIIDKNFKLLVRSKGSALIVILGPLLVIFLVGVAFDNSNTYSLNIGTYSDSYNELTDSFVNKLVESEFNVRKVDTQELCIEEIKRGYLHTCIVFPPDLDIESGDQNEVAFYVDHSKVNLVYMIMDTLTSRLSERSEEISKELTSVLVEKIDETKTALAANQDKVNAVKSSTNTMSSDANAIQSNLDSMDLGFGTDITNLNVLFSDNINHSALLKNAIIDRINNSKSLLSSIKGDANSIEDDDLKNDIRTQANDIISHLNNISGTLEDDHNVTVGNLGGVLTQLSSIQSKLSAAASAKDTSVQKINSIKSSVSQSISDINIVSKMFSDLQGSISGIKVTNAENIVSPIKTKIEPVTSEKTHLNYMFPSLIVLVAMFVGILLSTILIMMEKKSPAYFRNFITPTRQGTFILATFLTSFILVMVQVVVILIISALFFDMNIMNGLGNLILVLITISSLFIAIGMTIGYLFKSEETATLAAISAGSIFLFLSDIILPLESMPAYILDIARYNPFVLSEALLRKVLLFLPTFQEISIEFYTVLGYVVGLFILILLFKNIAQKHLWHRWFYYGKMKNRKKQEEKDKTRKKYSMFGSSSKKQEKIKKPKKLKKAKKIKIAWSKLEAGEDEPTESETWWKNSSKSVKKQKKKPKKKQKPIKQEKSGFFKYIK